MRAIRWSDNDRYFGPFTYARDRRGYRPIAVMLGSGDDDDYPHCRLRMSAFGHTLVIRLPQIISPQRRKVFPKWSAETIQRLGRDWYYDTHEREFGFTYSEGHLSFHFGAQTNEWPGTKSKGFFLPWTQWRHIRHSLYDLEGDHFADMPEWGFRHKNGYVLKQAVEDACPTVSFEFADFDGERITATTRIEEREWLFGTGYFKWLSLFRRPKIRRSLHIEFSAETGKRKGSWKGGTIGTGIDMLSGELHEAAFRRYCVENKMRFVGPASGMEARRAETGTGSVHDSPVGNAETPNG